MSHKIDIKLILSHSINRSIDLKIFLEFLETIYFLVLANL